jgi:hypothetical protein
MEKGRADERKRGRGREGRRAKAEESREKMKEESMHSEKPSPPSLGLVVILPPPQTLEYGSYHTFYGSPLP